MNSEAQQRLRLPKQRMRKCFASISDVSCNHHSNTSRASGARPAGLGWEQPRMWVAAAQATAAAGVLWIPELINHTLTGLCSHPEAGWAGPWAGFRSRRKGGEEGARSGCTPCPSITLHPHLPARSPDSEKLPVTGNLCDGPQRPHLLAFTPSVIQSPEV